MIRINLDVPDPDTAAEFAKVLRNAAGIADRRNHGDRAALWRRLAASIDDGLDTLNQLYTSPEE